MYDWWVFLHIAGAFGFLVVHGVSIFVALRLREERDASRINALLDISGRTVLPMYVSLGLLLTGGVVAGFLRDWWSFGWIWAALATLIVVSAAMVLMARPYYQRVRFISRAVSEGSKAVTPEQFDAVLRSRRPLTITWIGVLGLGFILYLMVLKPTLGLTPSAEAEAQPTSTPTGTVVRVESVNSVFPKGDVAVPAGERFTLSFRNADAGILHNISIYRDASAGTDFFKGELFPGPRTVLYRVPALDAGRYFYRCDVHPTTMTGTMTAS